MPGNDSVRILIGVKRQKQTTMTTRKPRIAVLALGGTIAMVKGKTAVRPGLSAENLIAAVPDLAELADLSAETISKLGPPPRDPHATRRCRNSAAKNL